MRRRANGSPKRFATTIARQLLLWADSDPALPFSVGEQVSERLNFPAPRKIADAGHYLQEDAGAEIGAIVAEWLG